MQLSPPLILANRSYLDHDAPPGSPSHAGPGDGGLLAAVRAVIEPWDGAAGTTWIGAGRGAFDDAWVDRDGFELLETPRGPLRHHRLRFDDRLWQDHYVGVANSFFWPLLHLVREHLPRITGYYPAPTSPSIQAWSSYLAVNEAFAAAAGQEATQPACWIHDYQLALAPAMLRTAGYRGPIGFFLHTPFPDAELVGEVLDERGAACFDEFVAGLLGADLVGLQTPSDVERLQRAVIGRPGIETAPGGLLVHGRTVRVGAYPVGIDFDEVVQVATTARLPAQMATLRGQARPLVVGLERSDYTKGIPERLRAMGKAYEAGQRFAYVGIAAPTRAGVPAYRRLEEEVARAAAFAAGAATRAGCGFLHLREAIPWSGVVALQREADALFTSSLADGMNLVPLQSAAAQSLRPQAERGAIIVGRDAGFAETYVGFMGTGFTAVDPLDAAAMERVVGEAVAGRSCRISDGLIAAVRAHGAREWATTFLADLEATAC